MLESTQQRQPNSFQVEAWVNGNLAGLEGEARTSMIDTLLAACEQYLAELDMSETATTPTQRKGGSANAAVAAKQPAAQPKKRASAPKLSEVVLSSEAEQYLLNQAIAKIRSGRLAELDPLVGDSACQLTALAVVDIARRLATTAQLSAVDAQILIDNEILTLAKNREVDPLLNIIKDSRSESSLPCIENLLDPDLYNKPAKGTFNRTVVTRYVAARIAHLTSVLSSDGRLGELLSIITNPLNQQSITRSQSYELTCLPCAASCDAVLMSELVRGNPILVTVKRFTRTILADGGQQSLRLQGIETFMFKPDAARSNFEFCKVPTQAEANAPCVHIFGNSIINIEGTSALPYLNTPSFEAYRAEFVAGDIMDKLRLCYVAHKQFPGRSTSQATFEQEGIHADPNSFTAMYQDIMGRVRSGNSGIPENNMLLPAQHAGVYSCYEMTYAIDHIFADTFAHASASNANMLEQVRGREVVASFSR